MELAEYNKVTMLEHEYAKTILYVKNACLPLSDEWLCYFQYTIYRLFPKVVT